MQDDFLDLRRFFILILKSPEPTAVGSGDFKIRIKNRLKSKKSSCIDVDFDQGGKHISVTGDIPLSAVQEFVAPLFLSDIIIVK